MILPDIILTPLKCNELIQTISKSYEVPKNFKSIKEVEKWEGYEECEDSSHSSYPYWFFSIFGFGLGFFRKSFHHLLSVMNLFKKYPSHMNSQKNLKVSKKWRNGRVRRIWGILTFFVPSKFSTCLEFWKFFGASYGFYVDRKSVV